MTDQPSYQGTSPAIHVLEDSFESSPAAPVFLSPTIRGACQVIATSAKSIAQWHDEMIRNLSIVGMVFLQGRSPAIHVIGNDVYTFPPENTPCGITDSFNRIAGDPNPPVVTHHCDFITNWPGEWTTNTFVGGNYDMPILASGNDVQAGGMVGNNGVDATTTGQSEALYELASGTLPDGDPDASREIKCDIVVPPLTYVSEDIYQTAYVQIGVGPLFFFDRQISLLAAPSEAAPLLGAPIDMEPNTTYHLRYQTGSARFKLWKDGDSEPSEWTNRNLTGVLAATTLKVYVQLVSHAAELEDTLDIGSISINDITWCWDTTSGGDTSQLGDSDSGLDWLQGSGVDATIEDGVMVVPPGAWPLLPFDAPFDTYAPPGQCQFDILVPSVVGNAFIQFGPILFHLWVDGEPGKIGLKYVSGFEPIVLVDWTWNPTQWYTVILDAPNDNDIRVKIWPSNQAQPLDWTLELTDDGMNTFFGWEINNEDLGNGTIRIENLDIDTVNNCTVGGTGGLVPPEFEPGFMPTFKPQIGDPTTVLDSRICTLESGAMVLSWHTRGAIDVWGGEFIPWTGRSEASIWASGTSLVDLHNAWLHYGQWLEVRSGQTWAHFLAAITEGRAVVLQGDYGEFTLAERCQDDFEEGHAVAVFPYVAGTTLLVGDPLCPGYTGLEIDSLQAYAEALGVAVYGVTTPQKILFAVSRPWVP